MAWIQTLLLLACPLMMLFCMRGMFTKKEGTKSNHQQVSSTDLQSLQIKVADLVEQNQKLIQEVELLREAKDMTALSQKVS